MAALCTPRAKRKPLRPVTPMGQDLPEDTPSKVRLRNAMECAQLRRLQEKETTEAELTTGKDYHAQLMDDRERAETVAKADTELRRDLFARQSAHKRSTAEYEAERQRVDKARAEEARKADETLKEVRRLDRELEKVETRQSQADTTLQTKAAKAKEQARERFLAAKAYQAGLAEKRRDEEDKKALKKEQIESKKAAMLEIRELRIKERALAAAKLRMEMEKAREVAKAKEEDRRKEAEEHREMLRARAGTYRADKELAKTSFYTR